MKLIAWGGSKILEIEMRNNAHDFAYCIDNFGKEAWFAGLPVKRESALESEDKNHVLVVVFAVSNGALVSITNRLYQLGFEYRKNFLFYSDFMLESFSRKLKKSLSVDFDRGLYDFALSYSLNSAKPVHTTIFGTYLNLQLLGLVRSLAGNVAEVGAFEGGNALCLLSYMTQRIDKKYFLFDSFEGFPELSPVDSKKFAKGDHKTTKSFEQIKMDFSIHSKAHLIRGFIPETFSQIPHNSQFSFVFFDCDLYRPALDTFQYFWPRLVVGGFLPIHDYFCEEGGFEGVKVATHEFFDKRKDCELLFFPESTMAVAKKIS